MPISQLDYSNLVYMELPLEDIKDLQLVLNVWAMCLLANHIAILPIYIATVNLKCQPLPIKFYKAQDLNA